jgi:ElaB/YqjD/DUF883 family membrane-anchored ribosome-binding protein
MSSATEADLQALIAEMKNLRADVERIGGLLKDTARHGTEDVTDAVRERAEAGWDEAKSKARTILEEMEQRPVQSALTIFGIGMLLGLMVARK